MNEIDGVVFPSDKHRDGMGWDACVHSNLTFNRQLYTDEIDLLDLQ